MSAIRVAIKAAGSQTALAQLISLSQGTIGQWVTGARPVPVERCHEIERALRGAVTCEQLRPDLAWLRVKDKSWPWHPGGRPTIDVSRSEKIAA